MSRRIFVILCLFINQVHFNIGFEINSEEILKLQDVIEDLRVQFREENLTLSEDEKILKQVIDDIPSTTGRETSINGTPFICTLCTALANLALYLRRVVRYDDKRAEDLSVSVCSLLRITSLEVCKGILKYNVPPILFIIDNNKDLTADTICKITLDQGRCSRQPTGIAAKNLEFTVNIDDTNDEKTSIEKTVEIVADVIEDSAKGTQEEKENLTIIQITDIHYDPNFSEGSPVDCGLYACCHKVNNTPSRSTRTAGYWGDYHNCDTPWRAIVNAFQKIKSTFSKIDAIYFTGDIVDHHMWETNTPETMQKSIAEVMTFMYEFFDGVPIFSTLGNHEAQNIFAPPDAEISSNIRTQWLYDRSAELWKKYLPADAIKTVKRAGYYTTLVHDKLRVISLNSNLCYIFNWWAMYESKIMSEQLQWFHDTLLIAEEKGEKVHVLSHMFNGHEDVHKPCSREYRRIMDRFKNIVVAEFHGHTEAFEFSIFYEENNSSLPISVAFAGGSLASFTTVNRNFMSYKVDSTNYNVIDADLWTYSLAEANQTPEKDPTWFKQFSLRESFNLSDLSPATLDKFVNENINNSSVIQQYWKMSIRESDDGISLNRTCSASCERMLLCNIVTADNSDVTLCKRIRDNTRNRNFFSFG